MASIIVKITDGSEIRRFSSRPEGLTYPALQKRINDLFSISTFKLLYKDDEGDEITMTSEDELAEAVGLARKFEPAVLRLRLKKEGSSSPKRTASPERADGDKPARPSQAPSAASAPSARSGVDGPGIDAFINNLSKQLPEFMAQLPESVKQLIPSAELDIGASLAANAAASASKAVDAAAKAAESVASSCGGATGYAVPPADSTAVIEGFHPGVSCDRSGECPIVGNRYNLRGHDYDLCEAEYNKLKDTEKAQYVKIAPPAFRHSRRPATARKEYGAAPQHAGAPNGADEFYGVHIGVTCDKSGESPIVGYRYHLPGRNYDLNQTEYDKLNPDEKAKFERVRLPPSRRCFGGGSGGGFGGHHGRTHGARGGHGFGPGGPFVRPPPCGGRGETRWAARFVCDLSIHDGTQMTAGTKFTKIWRMKNVGDCAWPAGARLLFVAGDQMDAPQSVLVSPSAVAPGQEIDVAVDMTAPAELGRYMGYFRLVGPYGRRKFGQRVWCHIQVVDDSSPAIPTTTEVEALLNIPRGEATDGEETADAPVGLPVAKPSAASEAMDVEAAAPAEASISDATSPSEMTISQPEIVASPPEVKPEVTPLESVSAPPTESDGGRISAASSQCELVLDKEEVAAQMASEAAADTAAAELAELSAQLDAVKSELVAMGFTDEALLNSVLDKHGPKLEECAQELASLSEWDVLLSDLEEMGFSDRERNRKLLVQHAGSLKKTVKDLVADAN